MGNSRISTSLFALVAVSSASVLSCNSIQDSQSQPLSLQNSYISGQHSDRKALTFELPNVPEGPVALQYQGQVIQATFSYSDKKNTITSSGYPTVSFKDPRFKVQLPGQSQQPVTDMALVDSDNYPRYGYPDDAACKAIGYDFATYGKTNWVAELSGISRDFIVIQTADNVLGVVPYTFDWAYVELDCSKNPTPTSGGVNPFPHLSGSWVSADAREVSETLGSTCKGFGLDISASGSTVTVVEKSFKCEGFGEPESTKIFAVMGQDLFLKGKKVGTVTPDSITFVPGGIDGADVLSLKVDSDHLDLDDHIYTGVHDFHIVGTLTRIQPQ